MFFGNISILVFVKFLWAGLVLGVISIGMKIIAKIFRKNIIVVNLFMFLFVMLASCVYILMCVRFNNFSLSWVGLLGLISGIVIIKISVDFFFDYFIRFIYNEFILKRGKNGNGKRKIQANKKVWKLC